MTKKEIIEYLYENNVRGDLTIEQMAEDIADTPQTDSEIKRNSLRTDCNGCRFVGTYDTEFPCANCVRKNKDYYSAEQTEREGE